MFERLDSRRLFAITSTFAEGILRVTGDAAENRISIVRNLDSGNLRVRSGDATLREVAYAQVLKIIVELGGGSDKLEIGLNVEKPTSVSGGDGNDTIVTGNGPDGVLGGAGNDIIITNGGRDSLFGNDGNDSLDGGLGGDSISGGGGEDGTTYAGRLGGVRVTLDNIANDGAPAEGTRPAEGDNVRTDVEKIIGGKGRDYISAAATTAGGVVVTPGRVYIDGGDNDDTLVGSSGGETSATVPTSVLNGGGGNDLITGGSKNDQLNGGGGNDTLRGLDGNDSLNGGEGSDSVSGGGGSDLATYADRTAGVVVTLDDVANDGLPPAGTFLGERDNIRSDVERVTGGKGSDRITGSNAANTLNGGEGNDSLFGLGGADILEGGANNDELFGGGGNDSLYGGLGNDKLFGGEDNDFLSAKDGLKDILDGGTGTEDRASRDEGLDEVINIDVIVV